MVTPISHGTLLGSARLIAALAVTIHELSTLPSTLDVHQLQALGCYVYWQNAAMCTWNSFAAECKYEAYG